MAQSISGVLDAMIEGQLAAVAAMRVARFALEAAALAIEPRLRDGGRLVYAGAGTSGRLAVQDGAELMPTFSWPQDRLLLLIAGGPEALVRSVEGAEDESDAAIGLVQCHAISTTDVLIAVAASGTTPFTLASLREAKRRGALTIGIANNRDTPILQEADHPIWLDTGPEPIAGSTRMKAGTAQRIALNLLSSLVIIRLGRVYRGLMVDLKPSTTSSCGAASGYCWSSPDAAAKMCAMRFAGPTAASKWPCCCSKGATSMRPQRPSTAPAGSCAQPRL